jgi:uncharacterized membrane protein
VTVNQDTADNIVTTVVHFDNVLKTGSIKIVKTAGDNQVTGIVFDITKDDGTYSTTATTGTDGTVTVGGLPIGTYTVKEDSVADRYVDPGSQDVTVNQDTADNIVTTVVHFDNVLKTTSIPDQGVPGSPGTGTTITDNNTPKGSNPNTGDHSGSVPLAAAAAAALSSLVALAGITLGIKIKRRRKA